MAQLLEKPTLSTCLICGYITFAHYLECPSCGKNRWDRKKQL